MKTLGLTALAWMFLVSGIWAGEQWRTFASADGQKSFEGVLEAYSEKAGKVKVKLKNGKRAVLPLEKLSKADAKWIRETGVWKLRAARLDVRLKRDKQSEEAIRDDNSAGRQVRTMRIHKEGFEIFISNPTKEDIEGLTCDWVFYARRKTADTSEVVNYKGSFPVTLIEPGEQFHTTTEHINLDQSERILGMVLYIKHGDKLLRTVETSPGIAKRNDAKIARQRR